MLYPEVNLVTALVPSDTAVLGKLSRQDEPDSSLDLTGGHGGLLVVAGQLGCLSGNLLEDVVDEGVQDRHGLGADSSVRVHLQGVKFSKFSSKAFTGTS